MKSSHKNSDSPIGKEIRSVIETFKFFTLLSVCNNGLIALGALLLLLEVIPLKSSNIYVFISLSVANIVLSCAPYYMEPLRTILKNKNIIGLYQAKQIIIKDGASVEPTPPDQAPDSPKEQGS